MFVPVSEGFEGGNIQIGSLSSFSISSLSEQGRILMKGPLQTIDLSNDEVEGIGQTCC